MPQRRFVIVICKSRWGALKRSLLSTENTGSRVLCPEAKTIPGCQALLCQQGSAFPRAAPFEVMQRRIQSPALWSEDLK